MSPIPQAQAERLPILQRKWLHETVVGVPTVVGLVGAAFNAATNNALPSWTCSGLIGAGGLASLGVYMKARRAHVEDLPNTRASDAAWVVSPLYTLHSALCADFGFRPEQQGVVRIAIHRVDWTHGDEGQRLEQSVEYVGGLPDGKARRGRRFPLRAGVIGRCAKDVLAVYAHRKGDDIEGFRREMVRDWGFTEDEAKNLAEDRWSYAAYPILEEEANQAGAVLYADTSKKGAFKGGAVKRRLELWCVGFAAFLREQSKEA